MFGLKPDTLLRKKIERNDMEGWIKLHRRVKESKVFANPEILKLWLLCLCKANHSHTWVHLDGISDPVEVHPGQFITGRYTLHREYYPTAGEKNKDPLTVWRWLKKLEQWGNVNIKANNKYSVIEVVNWDLYQNFENSDQENEQQANNGRTPDEHQVNTNNNDNNDDNDREEADKSAIPTLSEVREYFNSNGYDPDIGEKAFNVYQASIEDNPKRKYWRDSRDNVIKNWKLKMQSVWFKPENKLQEKEGFNPENAKKFAEGFHGS